jgi:hypothetical protein
MTPLAKGRSADELGMSKESIPDGRKAVSQIRILVLRQVHIIDQEEPPWSERGDRFAKFEDLPARGIGEDPVERSERSDKVGPVPLDDRNPVRPADTSRRLCDCRMELHTYDLHVSPGSDAVDDPGETHPEACADLQDPSPDGDGIGQAGHQ